MRFLAILLVLFFTLGLSAQNAVSLTSIDGKPFKVILKDTAFNKQWEAHVLIEKIKSDTLRLEIECENKKKYPATLYLLDKGMPTRFKEFAYTLSTESSKLDLRYTGIYELVPLPNPLVPKKPIVDTSLKYRNSLLGHLCELKDGKPLYFNNLPKEGICKTAMPAEYLKHANLLMSKAQVQDEKYAITENICRNNCLSVSQFKTLLGYIDYEVEKLKLVRVGYFNLTDPENQKELEKSFRFESSVNELNLFLKNPEPYRIKSSAACSQASSQKEMEEYQAKFSAFTNDSQRLEFLKKTYTELCYSTEQVTSLLQKFIHDREKLEAAKLLYFKCAQRNDYLKVTEAFSYNQTASELKDFIDKQQR